MSGVLLDVERLVLLAEQLKPSIRRSKIWRRQARKARESALKADRDAWLYNEGACEVSPEDEECDKQGETVGLSDLTDLLTEHLGTPRQSTSKGTAAKTNVVSLTRSKR